MVFIDKWTLFGGFFISFNQKRLIIVWPLFTAVYTIIAPINLKLVVTYLICRQNLKFCIIHHFNLLKINCLNFKYTVKSVNKDQREIQIMVFIDKWSLLGGYFILFNQ